MEDQLWRLTRIRKKEREKKRSFNAHILQHVRPVGGMMSD